jgi:hypothetical protein
MQNNRQPLLCMGWWRRHAHLAPDMGKWLSHDTKQANDHAHVVCIVI